MSDRSSDKPERQDPDAPPIVDNPRRRLMDAAPSRPRRINRAILRMPADPQPSAVEGGMPPLEHIAEGRDAPPPSPQAADQAGEGYVRIQLRVENGAMSVVSARQVAGPLTRPASVSHGFLYEVALGAQQIGIGAIPDLGVSRSYPRPPGSPGQPGHNITIEPSFEFAVRVPQQSLSLQALPRTRVALYRVLGDVPIPSSGVGLLGAQFRQALQVVAQLDGIRLSSLPPAAQSNLISALR